MNIIKLLTLIFSIFMISSHTMAETLVVGMSQDFKPYNYYENGQWRGIDLEICDEVYKRLGLSVEYREYPWKRVLTLAEKGEIGGILSVYCKDLRPFWENTSEPSYNVKISLFALKSKRIKVNEMNDLIGKSVGFVRGNYYGKKVESLGNIEIMEVASLKILGKLLARKRYDFAISENGPFLFNAKESGFQNLFEEVYTFQEDQVCMAFSKTAPGINSKRLAQKATLIMLQLKKEGFVQKILDKYLGK